MILNRTIEKTNKWRSQYNPLRGLTMQRAVSLLEQGDRGAYADLQWTYRLMEKRESTIIGLISRRTGAIKGLDWNIKTIEEDKLPPGSTQADADKQAAALRQVYDQIDNLQEAFLALAMAEFRGYAHLEKQVVAPGAEPMSPVTASHVNHLEPVEQWYWVRDSINGDWQYNGASQSGTVIGDPIEKQNFVIREVPRPINEIGLIAYVRKGLSEKDWDAFVEIYGVPGGVVVMPPAVPNGKESEYRDAAERVASGESGALPAGSDIKYPDGVRGMQPFSDHIRHQDEKMVLAGTGGLLTMLTESGSGTLAGTVHRETFEKIAKAEAKEISGLFQKDIDEPVLEEKFAGQPKLAYFELAAADEVDVTLVADHASKFASAGYAIDVSQLSEKTGYLLTVKPSSAAQGAGASLGSELQLSNRGFFNRIGRAFDVLLNRNAETDQAQQEAIQATLTQLVQQRNRDLAPVTQRLQMIAGLDDFQQQQAALVALQKDLPGLLPKDPRVAGPLYKLCATALANGFAEAAASRRMK